MDDRLKLRVAADNAFLRTQTQSLVRNRLASETEVANQVREANTARLRAQLLEKEALDRDVLAAKPPKKRRAVSR